MSDILEINRLLPNRQPSASDGAIGCMGAGEENNKGSSLPLIASILPMFKDSKRGWLSMLDANYLATKDVSMWGIQPTFVEKVWKSGAPKSSQEL
jgi:hypothetical protein